MRFAGIDIGSRTIEIVVLENGRIIDSRQTDTGFDPISNAKGLLNGLKYDYIMATGYGRHLFELSFEAETVTEIKAFAVGSRFLFPEIRTILDIGGQDAKVIAVNEIGRIMKFEMNDRCAAGTGRFLEVMAHTLGFRIDEFGYEALKAEKELRINSMCTVFAESEVTSLLAKGENRRNIALGLHHSVVRRALSMLRRVGINSPLLFAGGLARNPCIIKLLQMSINEDLIIPEEPQMVGAIGAAIISCEKNLRKK